MLKLLSIGNSFSVDAHHYLHDISLAGDCEIYCANLYIGGCSLETHYNNLLGNLANYEYFINGENTGRMISIDEAVKSDNWDIITLQQASGFSGVENTYFPYITVLADYVRKNSDAKILIHQTWSYEKGSEHEHFAFYENNQQKMTECIKNAYRKAAKAIDADVIPTGELIQTLRATSLFDYEKTGDSLNRDGFHLELTFGRYAAALLWFKKITGKSVLQNSFLPYTNSEWENFVFDTSDKESMEKINLIKETVEEITSHYILA